MRTKKLLAILLALMLVISVIPTSALADEAGEDTTTETAGVPAAEPEDEEPEGEPAALAAEDVAKIGAQGYATITAAIEAAGSSATTIEVIASTKEDVVIPENAKITLDLADGVTLTNVQSHTIFNNGNLTITGSGTVDNVTHGRGALYNTVGATAVLNGGTYTRSQENGQSAEDNGGNSWYAIKNFGTMTINAGVTVLQEGQYSSLLANGWQGYAAAVEGSSEPYPSAEAVLTINGGTFSGGLNTIKNDDYAKLTINGGEFINVAQYAVMNWNVATITGGTFETQGVNSSAAVWCGYDDDTFDKGQLTITGGTFETGNGAPSVRKGNESTTIEVTGGTFSSDITPFIPEGVALTQDSEGAVVVDTTAVVVAEVGGVSYKTLQAAINAAEDGDTVTLLANETLTGWIGITKSIALNLNGNTITTAANGLAFNVNTAGVKFTIQDETGNGQIVSANDDACNLIQVSAGELIVEGGTLTNNWYVVYVYQNGVATIKGGTLQSTVASAVSTNGSREGNENYSGNAVINVEGGKLISEEDVTIYLPAGTLNISGGEIVGATAVYSKCGTTNITGGTIRGTGAKKEFDHSNNGCSATGDAIVIEACNYPNGNPTVYISNGTFESANADAIAYYQVDENEAKEIAVSGGSFSSEVKAEYCAEGFVPVTEADANGKYTVTPDAENNEATVTTADGKTTVYSTLADAISAAGEGDTVTLLKDVELSGGEGNTKGIVTITEDITLDGQGQYTIKAGENVKENTSMINIQDGAKVTVQNLTIDGQSKTKHGLNINSSADAQTEVTVNNVTIKAGLGYGIVCNSSKLTATELITEGNAWGGVNVDSRTSQDAEFTMVSGEIKETYSVVIENAQQTNGQKVTAEIQKGTFKDVILMNISTDDSASLTIQDGTFGKVAEITKAADDTVTEKEASGMIQISGGTFDNQPKDLSVVDGYVAVQQGEKYIIRERIPSELKTDIADKTFIAGSDEWVEFTFSTVAHDDAGVTVYGGSDFGKTYEDKIAALEYKEGDTWKDMKGQNFGGSGFPMTDATSTFRVKFTDDAAGEYTFTASMKRSADDTELCNVEVKFTVSEKSTPVTPDTPTGSHGSSSSSVTTYPVTVDSAKHGTVTTSQKNASKGTTVTITVKPDDGYELDTLRVTDKNGDRVKVTEGKNGKFTFTMPAGKVTVEAEFAQTQETPGRRFTDVPEGYWAEDEINWAAENGYMNGNTATTFNPEGSVTRQQLWMILARLSGQRPADFAEAKAWAMDNGVSDGTNPGNAVSRQQLVTILYRYAVMMGYKTTGAADLTQFPDHASVAAYATDAMSWSVANGIVGGTTAGTLNPTGTATRAQFAVILSRFCEKIVG